jgi:hypothetical protein
MAETLFALGMRLKENEFIPMLREAADDNSENNSIKLLRNGEKLSELLSHSNGSSETNS